MKFKVGDRVNVYCSYMSNYGLSGEIDSISIVNNEAIKVIFDDKKFDSNWYLVKQCRKLVKKRKFERWDIIKLNGHKNKLHFIEYSGENNIRLQLLPIREGNEAYILVDKNDCKKIKPFKFKAGDRFIINIDAREEKGTITGKTSFQEYIVKFDDKRIGFFPCDYLNSDWHYIKKLVKKKTEFKVGDRVSCISLGYREKGTIEEIIADGNIIKVKMDNVKHAALCRPSELKKLVKKKKISRYKIIQEAINCLNESGQKLDEINKETLAEILSDFDRRLNDFKDSIKQKEPKLLPCPFCGCEDCHLGASFATKRIICPKCGIYSGQYCDSKTAIEYWNRRSYP